MTDTVNNSTSYLWYDYETFGTEARKDRPVQYGSFRTDTNFNIIGQSMVLYAQLADDYIPSPGSSLVTGITPMSLMDEENALAEADFAKVIRDEMGKPGTITIGYNNRNYDDEMTRFMFWRNLLPAYDTEYGEGRGRFDVFLLVIAVYAVAPQILNWPTKEDGTVCFKLDRLTPANNLPHRHAHDASSDAFATLQLAKLIASKNPRLWEYALSISKSDKIVELLNEKRPLLYVDRYSLHHRRGLRPVMPLFENPSVRNEWICWDLSADPNEMWAITEKDMKERSFVTREQKEQGIKPLPFVRIKTKKQPFLMKGMSVWITKNGQGLFEHPAAYYSENASKILASADRLSELLSLFMALADRKAEEHAKDIPEEALYSGGFPSNSDARKMATFRALPPEEMADAFDRLVFDREDLAELTLYFMGRNYPEYALTPETERLWRLHKYNKLVKGLGGARTFTQFYEELEEVRAGADEHGLEILEDVEGYVENLRSEYEA